MGKLRIKLNWYIIVFAALICISIILRVILAYNDWPYFDSDEGTLALMAHNILAYGEHPLVYYGQDYMGTIEAYLGAFFYSFLGGSVFAFRLGMVVLYGGFLLSSYFIARQLYTKNFGLFIMALFSFGSTAVLSRQLAGIGGYMESDFAAALAFAVALRLALRTADVSGKERMIRHFYFFLWSAAVGIGVWSDTIILPWVACAGLLLVLFCWREMLFKGAIFSWLAGFLVGGFPLIDYNLTAARGHDSISVLLRFFGHTPFSLPIFLTQMENTLRVSLPIASGDPVCHLNDEDAIQHTTLHFYGFENDWGSHCAIFGYTWSTCFVALIAISVVIGLIYLCRTLLTWRRNHQLTFEEYQTLVRSCAHLILLIGVTGVILSFMRSVQALGMIGVFARYLLGIWIGLAAVLWPLWMGATKLKERTSRLLHRVDVVRCACCLTSLVIILLICIYGSVSALTQIPAARTSEQLELQSAQTLRDNGVTHAYGYYWLCYRLAFYSNEDLTCSNTLYDTKKQRLGYSHNRYLPYQYAVQKDLYASYIVQDGDTRSAQYIEKSLKKQHVRYITFRLADGNTVYKPLDPVKHLIIASYVSA